MADRSTPARGARHPIVRILVGAIALVVVTACGGQGGGPPTGDAGMVRIEVAPHGVLLPALGATRQLVAVVRDEGGAVLDRAVTWHVEGSGVSVDAGGLVRATSRVGSAVVTARVGGSVSPPVVVIAAPAVAGAVLVDDDDVVALEAIDDGASFDLGWRYAVVLRRGTPSVGDLVIGTGVLPLGGRVVATEPVAAGRRVTLELVELDLLFDELSIDLEVPIAVDAFDLEPDALLVADVRRRGDVLRSAAPTAQGRDALVALAADDTFALGPFTCRFRDVELPLFSLAKPPEIELAPTLALVLAYDGANGGLQQLGVKGSVRLTIAYAPSLAAFEGTLGCTRKLGSWTLPIGGPLAFVFGAKVPVGVGFDVSGKVGVPNVGIDARFVGSATVEAGIDCRGPTGCEGYGTAAVTKDAFELRPTFPSVDAQFRAELAVFGFAYADLELGSAILDRFPALGDTLKLELVRARAGVEQRLDLASTTAQADDPAYASHATTVLRGDVKIGQEIPILERFERLLKVSIKPITLQAPVVPLWGSPLGQLTISPSRVRPGDDEELGELATFTVTIAESTFLGLRAVTVDAVELRWRRSDEPVGTPLAPGRGACFVLPRSSSAQTSFSCETSFTEEHLGEQTFYAFAQVRLFGAPLPVPFELALDSRRTLLVTDEERDLDPTRVVGIGLFHGIAVRSDGSVWGWGRSTLTHGGYDPTPRRVPGIDDVIAVVATGTQSIALRADGTIWEWELSGVLPPGVTCLPCVPTPHDEPVDVAAIFGENGAAFAVTGSGQLWAWGANGNGQLGIGGFGVEPFPYPVDGVPPIAWVGAGTDHSIMIAESGAVFGAGTFRDALNGMVPLSSDDPGFRRETDLAEPADVSGLARVSGAPSHNLAITTSGSLVSWGSAFAPLGYAVEPGTPFVFPPRGVPVSQPIAIAAGAASFAVDADGTLWAWGSSSLGGLGDGDGSVDRTSPGPVPGLPALAAVWTGGTSVAALGRDGSVWTWGRNDFGQGGAEPGGPCPTTMWSTTACQTTPIEILSLDAGP